VIIAIFGRSATGKTTIATMVGRELDAPVRHCGNALKEAAGLIGVSVDDAPASLHRALDEATQNWWDSMLGGLAVVEGRFLDQVLVCRKNMLLIELLGSVDKPEPASRACDHDKA
jgi:cytidylate kinase